MKSDKVSYIDSIFEQFGLTGYTYSLKFTNRFSDYNSNVRMRNSYIEFRLSTKWSFVDESIRAGLIEHLLCRILKRKSDSLNITLYNNFVRNLDLAVPKDSIDPFLSESFDRVNQKYFESVLEKPNLVWGKFNRHKLGCYDFHSDTIKISRIFDEGPIELLDYVMYHEMLHKNLKFTLVSGSKSRFHTREFRSKEKEFENSKDIDKKLENYIRTRRRNHPTFLSRITEIFK